MASTQHVNLSPAELAYLHASLSLTPPLRPDGRSATQFRPLSAETGILPSTNGSARICFADGTEAIVGVKAEIGKTGARYGAGNTLLETDLIHAGGDDDDADGEGGASVEGQSSWIEIAVEIPGARDDDASTIYLAEMLSEALLADGQFARRLYLNRRFHWKLYLDVSRRTTSGTPSRHKEPLLTIVRAADPSDIAASILPPAPSLPHNPPRAAGDTITAPEIRRRRGPAIRRRLGLVKLPVPPRRRSLWRTTAGDAARHGSRRQHYFRPREGGARRRRLRAGNLSSRCSHAQRRGGQDGR